MRAFDPLCVRRMMKSVVTPRGERQARPPRSGRSRRVRNAAAKREAASSNNARPTPRVREVSVEAQQRRS